MIRRISWVKPALKAFQTFPRPGAEPDDRSPAPRGTRGESRHRQAMKGLGAGIYEIALAHRGDAYRAVYAVQLGDDLWVVHAFQKKSKSGIKTPQQDIDLIQERINRLKEQL
jgi:phage-related protein